MKKIIKNKVSFLVIGMLLCSHILWGCKTQLEGNEATPVPVTPETEEISTEDAAGETDKDISDGINAFSFTMGNMLYQNDIGKNFVNSPLSLWLPLAALLNTVEEENRDEVLKSLGLHDVGIQEVNEAVSHILSVVNKEQIKEIYAESGQEFNPALTIANMIFVSKEYTLNPEFASIYEEFYKGGAMEVDFNSDEAVKAVNEWAKDNTQGKIEKVIESFDTDTAAAIANAIYFSDGWITEFDQRDTQQDTFYGEEEELTADYMQRTDASQNYYEDDILQAAALDFQQGGGLYILLPKEETASQLFGKMDLSYFESIQEGMKKNVKGNLRLPKFSITGDSMNLMSTLEALRIPYIDRENPVIAGLVTDAGSPLYISSAFQKAMIEVDEKGATAAAVTVIAISEMSMIIDEPEVQFEMDCNKPFVFILTEKADDGKEHILFTGVVNAPEE